MKYIYIYRYYRTLKHIIHIVFGTFWLYRNKYNCEYILLNGKYTWLGRRLQNDL